MSFSFLAILLLLVAFLLVEARPTIDNLGVLLRERSPDPAFLARLEQIMGNDFASDGRLFNLQRLG